MADTLSSSGIQLIERSVSERLSYNGIASSLHSKTISRLIARRKLSERAMTGRFEAWRRVDDSCRLFIDLSRQAKRGDGTTDANKKEIPWARSIVVPMSYAILQVYLTQLIGIFTRRDPPIEIQGIGPEDVKRAHLMNSIIGYDQTQTNYILELYTVLQDGLKYGMGGFHDCWEEEWGWKTNQPNPELARMAAAMGYPLPDGVREWSKTMEYNSVHAWDPYYTYPDPRVSLSNLQRGEFFGHAVFMSGLDIIEGSEENGGNYFNTNEAARVGGTIPPQQARTRQTMNQFMITGSTDDRDKGFHVVYSFTVRIIPREWELGESDRPEKWQFTWADDRVIIRAHPADYEHGKFCYSGAESNIDTHVFGNQGSIENLDGLQRFMNWKYNSHVQNLIRFLNNRSIYDAALVEEYDVVNSDAAGNIRLTPLGSMLLRDGRLKMNDMIHQLELTDVTGPMMKDLMMDMDFAMRMSGAADQMMGRVSADKRTLGEISRVGHEGSARMAMHAMMFDVQAIRQLALRWTSNRQQYTSDEQYVRITGSLAKQLGTDRVLVKPGDLAGNYDYIPKTGPEPMDPSQRAGVIMDGMTAILKQPALLTIPRRDGKVLDVHELIGEWLLDNQIRNVDDFYQDAPSMMGGQPGQTPPGANVQVMPDEQMQKQVQAGNVIPMQGRIAA